MRSLLSAEGEDGAAPGLEAVLGGDADPERVVALRLQRDAQAVRHAAVRVLVRQAAHPDPALEDAGLPDAVVAADLRPRAREAASVAGEREVSPQDVRTMLRNDRAQAHTESEGDREP